MTSCGSGSPLTSAMTRAASTKRKRRRSVLIVSKPWLSSTSPFTSQRSSASCGKKTRFLLTAVSLLSGAGNGQVARDDLALRLGHDRNRAVFLGAQHTQLGHALLWKFLLVAVRGRVFGVCGLGRIDQCPRARHVRPGGQARAPAIALAHDEQARARLQTILAALVQERDLVLGDVHVRVNAREHARGHARGRLARRYDVEAPANRTDFRAALDHIHRLGE